MQMLLKCIILREFPDFNSALFGVVSYFISPVERLG